MTQQPDRKAGQAGPGGSIPEKLDRINRHLEILIETQGKMQHQLATMAEQTHQSIRSHHQELSQEINRISKIVQVLQTG